MDDLIRKMADMNSDKELAEIKIRYGLELLKNEIYKLVILLIFFMCIGKFPEYLFSLALLLPVRIYSGGLHMTSNISCFVFSFCFTILSICILPQIKTTASLDAVIYIAAFILIAVLSPFSSPKKPITTKSRYIFFKGMSCLMCAISIIILWLIYHLGYIDLAHVGMWTIFLQSLQLLPAHLLKKWRKGNVQEI